MKPKPDVFKLLPASTSGWKLSNCSISLLFLLLVSSISLWYRLIFLSRLESALDWHPGLVRQKSTITWESCPDHSKLFCAFFAVPLDYSNLTGVQDRAIIAMRMYPATVPPSQRLGTIFTNPGGPGTSGHALIKTGPSLSVIFHGKFDIVSWDPRGVNMSTPRISCHSTELQRQLFALGHESGDLDLNGLPVSAANRTLLTASARARLLTDLCRGTIGDKVLRSVTTVNVARDLEEMRKAVGDGGLHFWGFSYGTTLGATYAAMFPENVERMVLDGVVYTPEQYTSLLEHGMSSGDSTRKVFDGFVSGCITAGPSRCALLINGTQTAPELAQRISDILTQLDSSPLPVAHPNSPSIPSILRSADLRLSIFATLLRPANWVSLASALAALERGDGTAIAALSGREMGGGEADMAVSCGDAPPFPDAGDDAAWTHTNPLSGPIWFKKMVRCRHWGLIQPPPERYEGQWKMGLFCRHPILFVSNTFDPVSPISSGRRMVDVFGRDNARLLEHHAYGRVPCSQPSLCIANAIREYMVNGTLPAEGMVCQPNEPTFPRENGYTGGVKYEDDNEPITHALENLVQAGIRGGW
ncbi:Alpha/Beta hydrolase protein [Mycena epipterygia]|nr:Alpha/Beta hydrolase protein [Mycena epipterygia]